MTTSELTTPLDDDPSLAHLQPLLVTSHSHLLWYPGLTKRFP